ncbi:MAG: ABC transporter permease [Candidatus Saccharimonadales bacterium]
MKLANIFRASNVNLIKEMVRSDFKLRYQASVLGYLWSLLRPLMLFGVLYVIFTRVFKTGKDIPYYPAYLLLGLVMWTFFVEATMSGMNSIVGRGDLIRKVSIPKYVIVISTTLSAFVNFALNMVVVFIFMAFGHVPLRLTILIVPLLIGELLVYSLAISFILAALFVKFRDIGHIWEVVLQVLFYATPLIYAFTIVPHALAKVMSINPLAQIFQDTRAMMITSKTLTTKQVFNSQLGRLLPMAIVIVLAIFASWYFKRSSASFAEEI